MAEHEQAMHRRQRTVDTMVLKYDASGDGVLQRDEFGEMVRCQAPSTSMSMPVFHGRTAARCS